MDPAVPLDTDPEVHALQVERWRRMTPAERAEVADRLSTEARELAIAGIRHANPGISEEALRHELVSRLYGRDFADEVYGPRGDG